MRKGISITVTAADRVRLRSIIRDRNSPQKHVWRARIIVLTADGEGTTGVMRAVGKGKTVVWRQQERFMREGIEGLTRDKDPALAHPPTAGRDHRSCRCPDQPIPAAGGDPLDRVGDGQGSGDQPVLGAADLEEALAAAPSGARIQA